MSPPASERAERIAPHVHVTHTLRPSYGARTAQRAVPTTALAGGADFRTHNFGSGRPSSVLPCVNSNALPESFFFPTADALCAKKPRPLQLARLHFVQRSSECPRLAGWNRLPQRSSAGSTVRQSRVRAPVPGPDGDHLYERSVRREGCGESK